MPSPRLLLVPVAFLGALLALSGVGLSPAVGHNHTTTAPVSASTTIALGEGPAGELASSVMAGTQPPVEGVARPDPDREVTSAASHRSRTYLIGDSITYGAYSARLHRLRPGWEVSAHPGRTVTLLPWFLASRLANPSPLRTVVIALGTNAARAWTYDDLRAAVSMVPTTTRVVLVTTYRHDSRSYPAGTYRYSPSVQRQYTAWMRRIAVQRPHTCIAPWRSWAVHHQGRLTGGVHPGPSAKSAWASIVTRAVSTCR